MTPTPTASTEDFRRQAVELLVTEKPTVAEAARRIGVNAETLRKWTRKFLPTPTVAPTPSVEQELRPLREENRQLKMEREILKSGHLLRAGSELRFAFVDAHWGT